MWKKNGSKVIITGKVYLKRRIAILEPSVWDEGKVAVSDYWDLLHQTRVFFLGIIELDSSTVTYKFLPMFY